MKGYYYLMWLWHLINILAQYSERFVKMMRELGARSFIRFARDTISGRWIDALQVQKRLATTFQL